MYRDPSGVRQWEGKFKTRHDAQERLNEVLGEIDKGTYMRRSSVTYRATEEQAHRLIDEGCAHWKRGHTGWYLSLMDAAPERVLTRLWQQAGEGVFKTAPGRFLVRLPRFVRQTVKTLFAVR